MANQKRVFSGFPVGASVLLDGKHRARVRAFFPEGSTSFAFPHYVIRETGRGEDSKVETKRIGVTPR